MQETTEQTTTQVSNKRQQKDIDNASTLCYRSSGMARLVKDTLDAIRNRIVHDAARLEDISKQMGDLSRSYNLYVDLLKERESHEKSAQKLAGLLGPDKYFDPTTTDEMLAILAGEIEDTPDVATLRQELPLWEAVKQLLRFVPEARTREILEFFKVVGIEATRQAVESGIRAHPRTFRVVKRGREKFISLKKGMG
jgi:hypothetical protein